MKSSRLHFYSIILAGIFFVLYSVPSFSLNKVWIGRSESHQPWLEIATPCEQISDEIKAMQSLTQLDFDNSNLVLKSDSKSCRIELNHVLQGVASELVATVSRYDGPNCWNTALRISGLVQFSRFTSDQEFSFWLHSPYCRQLKQHEPSQPGDIVAMRVFDPDKKTSSQVYSLKQAVELHAMVYISPLLVFSKDTSKLSDPFEIKEGQDVYNLYRFDSEQCKKIEGISSKECFRWANYYRCSRPDQDRETQMQNSDLLNSFSRRVQLIEEEISKIAMGQIEFSKERLPEFKAEIDLITNKLSHLKYKEGKKDFFRLELIQILKSLDVQTTILSRPSL